TSRPRPTSKLTSTVPTSPDCKRWGNVQDGLFDPKGWTARWEGPCQQCKSSQEDMLRAERLAYDRANMMQSRSAIEACMWLQALDEMGNKEVAMLQLGLLVDHAIFVPHDVARRLIERDREEARRSWIIALKVRVSRSGRVPTLDNLTLV
ncbi:hypothetical protein P7C70_g8806, partial [Phenoliferia sp. Uapishka_3]